MCKARREFPQGSQTVSLLFDARGLADSVGHQSHQARGELRHFLYKLREVRRRKTQQPAIAECASGHRRALHPRKGQKTGYLSRLDRKRKCLAVNFASRLEFSFQHYEHVLRRITLADVCISGFEDLFLALADEPGKLIVGQVSERCNAK